MPPSWHTKGLGYDNGVGCPSQRQHAEAETLSGEESCAALGTPSAENPLTKSILNECQDD